MNRDLYSLLNTTGGVTSNDNSNSLGGPEQLTTINGSQKAQIGSVNFQLDGGNNTAGLRGTGNPAPNPEAVQEFRVITSNATAEYGRSSGAQVALVTKSGTNQLRASAYYNGRRDRFNENDYFRKASGQAKPLYRVNISGYSIGGPVIIPKVHDSRTATRKVFFFFSQDVLARTDPGGLQERRMPTELERRGDFSQTFDTNGSLIQTGGSWSRSSQRPSTPMR